MAFIKFKPLTAVLNYNSVVENFDDLVELKDFLLEKEHLFAAAKSTRDLFVITNKRIIIIDLKGLRGFRRSIYTIRYKSVSTASIEVHNLDTTMVLNIDNGYNVEVKFSKPLPLTEMYKIYNYIAEKIID